MSSSSLFSSSVYPVAGYSPDRLLPCAAVAFLAPAFFLWDFDLNRLSFCLSDAQSEDIKIFFFKKSIKNRKLMLGVEFEAKECNNKLWTPNNIQNPTNHKSTNWQKWNKTETSLKYSNKNSSKINKLDIHLFEYYCQKKVYIFQKKRIKITYATWRNEQKIFKITIKYILKSRDCCVAPSSTVIP